MAKRSVKNKKVSDGSGNKVVSNKPSRKILKEENKQLFWIILIIVLVFASFIGSYVYVQKSKVFEYGNASWAIEDYKDLRIYHGVFGVFTRPDLKYNIFLRVDPRENNVSVDGTLDRFTYNAIVSYTPAVNECLGELPRVVFDLNSLLLGGVGMRNVEMGTTDYDMAREKKILRADCSTAIDDVTVIIIDRGDKGIFQNPENPYCYSIQVRDCGDLARVEKFMTQSISDFKESH